MIGLTHYQSKPNTNFNRINTRLARDLGVGALFANENVNFIDFLSQAPLSDRIQTQNQYIPWVAAKVPFVTYIESGSTTAFPNSGSAKGGNTAYGYKLPFGVTSDGQRLSLFAIATSTPGSNPNFKTLVGVPNFFNINYKHTTNTIRVSVGFNSFDVVAPVNANDGKQHMWGARYDRTHNHRLRIFFDGEQLFTAPAANIAMPSFADFGVGTLSTNEFNSWSGNIALAGYSTQGWSQADFIRLNQSPFELLWPTQRRISTTIPPGFLSGQTLVRPRLDAYAGVESLAGAAVLIAPTLSSDTSVAAKLWALSMIEPFAEAAEEVVTELTPTASVGASLGAVASVRSSVSVMSTLGPLMSCAAQAEPKLSAGARVGPAASAEV